MCKRSITLAVLCSFTMSSWILPPQLRELGTIQVLSQQRGGWVGSENGNFDVCACFAKGDL